MKPVCAIYSTFLQRGFDQIVHDVALQRLPVRFAIDRAGLVGNDGATHAGSYDLGYMSMLPGMVMMAPADAIELRRMVATAMAYDEGPIAFRYPRGETTGPDQPLEDRPLEIGQGRILTEGTDVAILSIGSRLEACLEAARDLAHHGISATVADARFCKPLDTALVERLARSHELVITVEEGAVGGFGSHVLHHLAQRDLLRHIRVRNLMLPDAFIAHGSPAEQLADAGLDSASIASEILALHNSGAIPNFPGYRRRAPHASHRNGARLHS
jgi:1-deoxy-D-xylulose-5-phosphate synthase